MNTDYIKTCEHSKPQKSNISSKHLAPAEQSSLDAQLSATPVTALCVVADGVITSETNPVRDGAVLAGGLGQDLLGLEALVAWHG